MKMNMESKIISLLRKRREGLSFQKIARQLHLSPGDRQVLKKKLKKLKDQGVILRLKRRYFVPLKSNLVKGRFVTSRKGYGFVDPEEDSLDDIFIPGRYSGGAVQGDLVEVLYQEKGKKGKPEGRVIKIINREKESLIGLYKERYGQPFFLPFDSPSTQEVPLKLDASFSPQPGMIVEVLREGMSLTEILGKPDDPGVDTKVVIHRYNLSSSFPEEVIIEAEKTSSEISDAELKKREDFRSWTTVTIDGENAKDFDDAVSVRKVRNGHFLLGVHIADVSYYVKENSHLDAEAFKRGTSVYFPGLTLPMLPEKISNDICSLRPRKERLTVSVLLEIDREGRVIKEYIHPSLIKTEERMTYQSVFKIFEGVEKEKRKFSDLVPDLLLMRELARLLKRKREKEGSLDFDLQEPELVYKEGYLHSVIPFERNEAHQIIEEFMVAANEAVASFLQKKDMALIFRIHPPPTPKNLERLREILRQFTLPFPLKKNMGLKDLQRILKEVENKPEEKFVNLQVLKSMKLAVYSDENKGHYGLAKREYTHFTSPIRRYPDLVVHRILKKALKQEKLDSTSLPFVAFHCSLQERKAEEAERELIEWRIFRFLKEKLGEEFEGIVVDITKTGLIVELDDYFVDGFVPFSDLGGDYYLRGSERILVGRRTGETIKLGKRFKVILTAVDPILRRMNLTLSPEGKEGTG